MKNIEESLCPGNINIDWTQMKKQECGDGQVIQTFETELICFFFNFFN